MHVKRESAAETDARLTQVLAGAEVEVMDGDFAFEERELATVTDAIAWIRDDAQWSCLVPARGSGETFALFRIHFRESIDNSGFVGWLASNLKARLGTGVFVICGFNGHRGGIFDYWGCPSALRNAMQGELRKLARAL